MIRFIRGNKLIKKPISHQKDKYKEVILQEGEIPGLLQFARSKFKKMMKLPVISTRVWLKYFIF